jgi:hypothetical protein
VADVRFGLRTDRRAFLLINAQVTSAAALSPDEKGKRHRDTQKTEDQAKKKADEKAYEDDLKNVPASKASPLEKHAIVMPLKSALHSDLRGCPLLALADIPASAIDVRFRG